MALERDFIKISLELDQSGLLWLPEIGDEVTERGTHEKVAVFVDPQGLTPRELRQQFIWLPTVEQLVNQLEARQAMVYHAGITSGFRYEVVVKAPVGVIETDAATLRSAFGSALFKLLTNASSGSLH